MWYNYYYPALFSLAGIPIGSFSLLSMPLHLSFLTCLGNESSLLDCPSGTLEDDSGFDTLLAAGVRCQGWCLPVSILPVY